MSSNFKVAINATCAQEKPTGLGIYTHELVSALLKQQSNFDFTVYTSSPSLQELATTKTALVSKKTSPALGMKGHLLRLLWLQSAYYLRLKKQKPTLLYSTAPETVLLPGFKQIVTVLDLIPLKFPEQHARLKYNYKYAVPLALKQAKAIICISENTKKDMIEQYGIKDKPIEVIYAGFNRELFYPRHPGIAKKKYRLSKYLLSVGDSRPYKNIEKSIEAFARLNLKDLRFVIVGKKDPRFYPQLKKKIEALSLEEQVIFLGYVPENDLPALYSDALGFVFASQYEGFGLPALEAMACGCPVIASETASLPEVCGDAAFYINPNSVETITKGMYAIATDKALRTKLTAAGLQRATFFSWEKAAKQTLQLIEATIKTL